MTRTRRSVSRAALLVILTALSAGAATAAPAATDEDNGSSDPARDLPSVEERQQRLERLDPNAATIMPHRDPRHATLSPDTQKAYEDALRAYYRYRQQGYVKRLQAFEWQAWSSKVIFVVVLLLVFVGIVFAALQFRAGLVGSGKAGELDTEFSVDLKGVRVRSPVLGVIVLTISLAFFYLYLVYVYPIFNVF